MIAAQVCMTSVVFRLWLYTATIIFIVYSNDDLPLRLVRAAEGDAADPPVPSQTGTGSSQAIGGVTAGVPSTIFFNQTQITLSCHTKERTPGYITTAFLFNPPYSFGCLSNDTSSYYFSVVLSIINFPNTPVWAANRHHPVKDNASFFLTPQGSLLLLDYDGTQVWSSGKGKSRNPAGLRLTAQGNLIFFDEQNLTVWQSYSEPLDLLVPGQTLDPGGALVAGFSSHTPPTGTFVAVMKSGGLIFYENSTSRLLPYYALRYPFTPTTADGVLSSPCNHTELQLTSVNITQIQLSYTSSCKAAKFDMALDSIKSVSFGSAIAFVRLEPNGVIKGHYLDHKVSYDLFQNSSRGLCGIPNVCGPYGICDDNQWCACPPGNESESQYFTSSTTQEYLLTSTSCTPKIAPLGCHAGGTRDHHFLDLTKVDYFANDMIDATLRAETFDLCKAACANSCSCEAVFYRKVSKQCYLHESVMSIIRVQDGNYTGAIKLQKKNAKKSNLGMIIGIVAVALVLVMAVGLWCYYRKRKRGMHRPLSKDEDDLLASLPGQPRRFSFKELQAATSEFSQKLGVGGFGSVYRGMLQDGSSVAVKQLESTTRFTQGMKEFRNEVIALSNINHQNLVHLRGFCADGGHRLLVYEYVPNGSLDVWLFRKGADRPGPILDWKTRLAIAVHTARGLVFLHEQCRNRIVHLDIKPQNILLDEQFVPKLSDFGLSRLINEDQDSAVSRMRGTPGYMAPECLILTDATEKSDVYSFGMVLLEILSGRKNVDVSRLVVHGDGDGWYFPALAARKYREGNVLDIIDKSLGQLGEGDLAEAARVIKLAFWCIQDDPSIRPTMGNALLMLEGYSKVQDPPLSCQFGMQFHLSNSISTNSRTPQHHLASPKKRSENGDHCHGNESEAKAKREGRGESTDFNSRYASPLSSHHTSPRSTPTMQLSPQSSVASTAFHSASPRHSSPPPHRLSPVSSHRATPRHLSPTSSPRGASPLPSSPLSPYSQSPSNGNQPRGP